MSSTAGNIFSDTLREITTTKLVELSKRRSEFAEKKDNTLAALESEADNHKRLTILWDGVRLCYGIKTDKDGKIIRFQTSHQGLETSLNNLDAFLAQARHDPSIATKTYQTWEASMLHYLDAKSLKFQYASLYAQIVTEWLSSEEADASDGTSDENDGPAEELPSRKKLEGRLEWERNVFEPATINEKEVEDFLTKIFREEKDQTNSKAKAMKNMSDAIATFENQLSFPNQFNSSTLHWVISGLLGSDLLSDEKREVLRSFQSNDVILTEVADVLNMRIAALDVWSWGASVPVEQQRKISGTYNIVMHEDLLQAMFLQYIGVKWSVLFKTVFKEFRKTGGPWVDVRREVPKMDAKRRGYYVGPAALSRSSSIQHVRRSTHRREYFVAQLLNSVYQNVENPDGEEEADVDVGFAQASSQSLGGGYTTQTAGMSTGGFAPGMQGSLRSKVSRGAVGRGKGGKGLGRGGAMRHRRILSYHHDRDDEEDSETDSEDDPSTEPKKPMESKQKLLHLLSTEIAVTTRIHGEITAFRSAFDTWNSLMPHATIRAVLKFLGVSNTWLHFFARFLEAPLRFMDDDETQVRTRRRGSPASHALTEVFGEVLLFCLDFSINQATSGNLLYRMYDEFWFWSRDHQTAVTAWKMIQKFRAVTGAKLNFGKTGTVRISGVENSELAIDPALPQSPICWGFLRLSCETGRFEISQDLVDQQIDDLRKQLRGKQRSVFAFIQTWNTYAATFFTSNFGKPANCFGLHHVDQMLATHSRIQREIFADDALTSETGPVSSVVDYLKAVLEKRFGVFDIPDAYLFFPVSLGGLELKSPFISILQVRNSIAKDPSVLLNEFSEAELEAYSRHKKTFEKGEVAEYRQDPTWEPADATDREHFMSFDEFTRWREEFSQDSDRELAEVYKDLLQAPVPQGVDLDDGKIAAGIKGLQAQQQRSDWASAAGGGGGGIMSDWSSMEPYWRWVAMLYGPEVMDRFGGLNIVDPGLLPMGMLSVFRDRKVKWQG